MTRQRLHQSHAGKTNARSGFALLEAIVAIVILASALIPIYGLISTTISGAFRLGAVNQRSEVVLNTLEVMSSINPAEQPSGTISLGEYDIFWESDVVLPPVDGANYPRGISLYQISLYNTHVEARASQTNVLARFDVQLVGYKRVREINLPFSAPPR